jgi:CopG family nickel-responsive transcriptional regulator
MVLTYQLYGTESGQFFFSVFLLYFYTLNLLYNDIMALVRFGVSLDKDILQALDDYVVEYSMPNRSQAIRHLVENNLIEKKWLCNQIVAGAIVLLYNHEKNDIATKITDIQHDYFEVILSMVHFHLSHEKCLEIVAVKGEAFKLTELSCRLIGLKGIIHGKLVMSKTE